MEGVIAEAISIENGFKLTVFVNKIDVTNVKNVEELKRITIAAEQFMHEIKLGRIEFKYI